MQSSGVPSVCVSILMCGAGSCFLWWTEPDSEMAVASGSLKSPADLLVNGVCLWLVAWLRYFNTDVDRLVKSLILAFWAREIIPRWSLSAPLSTWKSAPLFIIARTWKQPRYPSADERIRKLWYIYTMEYYSAIKKNTFESVLMRWMKLEPIIQSEVSQKE